MNIRIRGTRQVAASDLQVGDRIFCAATRTMRGVRRVTPHNGGRVVAVDTGKRTVRFAADAVLFVAER